MITHLIALPHNFCRWSMLMHWSYFSFALSHRCMTVSCFLSIYPPEYEVCLFLLGLRASTHQPVITAHIKRGEDVVGLLITCSKGTKMYQRYGFTVNPLIKSTPNPKTFMILLASCSCLCPIHWSQVLSRKWRCSWSSADRRCYNYIWVINNFIAC